MKFYAPIPRIVGGENHHDLIRRLFRRSATPGTQRIDLITTTNLRVSIIDCGNAPLPIESEADTIIHLLWQLDESVANITIGGDTWPIAPGDTAAIPGGDEWCLSPNQLTIQIVRRSHELALPIAPHHGTESFIGHNRRTSYDPLALQRWKLTEPCTIPTEDDLVLVGLHNDLALQHHSEIGLMPQGEVRVARGEGPITMVPNGLSYALTIPGT